MFTEFPDIVSVVEVAQMLKIGTVLAYRLVKTKKIKSKKIGREYKILKSDVMAFLQEPEKDGI